jgi:hypothetical protein
MVVYSRSTDDDGGGQAPQAEQTASERAFYSAVVSEQLAGRDFSGGTAFFGGKEDVGHHARSCSERLSEMITRKRSRSLA